MFIGELRRSAVDQLIDVWSVVKAERLPRLVSLVGEPGFGKTRIVQEFYRRVMELEDDNEFWPPSIGAQDEDPHADGFIRSSRKAVRPEGFVPPDGSAPSVIWIGTVLPDSPYSVDSAPDDIGHQIEAVFASVLNQQTQTRLAARLALMLAGLVVPPLALGGVAAAGLQSVELGIELQGLFSRGPDNRELGAHAGHEERLSAFFRMTSRIWDVSGLDGPPLVIVIEDAHGAQNPTVALVERLITASNLPILLILCSQTQALDNNRALSNVLRAAEEKTVHMEVAALTSEEIEDLLRTYIPRTSVPVLSALARKADGNPYHAQLLVQLLTARVTDGELVATPTEIATLSSSFEDILGDLWESLLPVERTALALRSLVGSEVPIEIDELVLSIASHEDGQPKGDRWIRYSSVSRAFLELARWEVATRRGAPLVAVDLRTALVREALGALDAYLARPGEITSPALRAIRVCSVHVVAQATELGLGAPGPAVLLVLLDWARELRWQVQREQSNAVVAVLKRSVLGEQRESIARDELSIALEADRLQTINTIAANRRGSEEAISAAEQGLELASQFPEQTFDLLRAHLQLSRACRVIGTKRPALIVRSKEHLDIAWSLWNASDGSDLYAFRDLKSASYPWESRKGDRRAAAQLAAEAGDLAEKLYGSEHPLVREALTDRAYYLKRVERAQGIEAYRDVLALSYRLWSSASHPTTAKDMKNLAAALLTIHSEETAEEAKGLADSAVEYLGQFHGREARLTSYAIGVAAQARTMLAAYRPGQAASLLEEAISLATLGLRIQKQHSPSMSHWPIRQHLAEARSYQADPEGVEEFERILAARERGHEHPERRAENRLAAERLVRIYDHWGRKEQSADLTRRYRLLEPETDVLAADEEEREG